MKKIAFIGLLLASFLQAQDFDTFIGLEAGNTQLNDEKDFSERGGNYGLRIGFIKDTGRMFLSANMASLDGADLNSIALNFDAITPSSYRVNSSFALRGFIGVHGGFAQLKPDNFEDDEGGMGGGQAGILLDFPADITLEIGYKITWAALDIGNERVKNYQNIYAAFDYTF